MLSCIRLRIGRSELDFNALLIFLDETLELLQRVEDLDSATPIIVRGLQQPEVVAIEHFFTESVFCVTLF